ncbi:MAG: hypothetical protein R2822_15065 [Spirosomataceae bacterium]
METSVVITAVGNNPTACGGNDGNIVLSGLSANITYAVSYKKMEITLALSIAPAQVVPVTITTLTAGVYTEIIANFGSCTSTESMATLNNPPLPIVNTPSTSLCVGNTLTLSPTTGGTWVSSNLSFASVTDAGLVTGISSGVVNFTFTVTGSG